MWGVLRAVGCACEEYFSILKRIVGDVGNSRVSAPGVIDVFQYPQADRG